LLSWLARDLAQVRGLKSKTFLKIKSFKKLKIVAIQLNRLSSKNNPDSQAELRYLY